MEEYGTMVNLILMSLIMIGTMGFLYHFYLKYAPAGMLSNGANKKNNPYLYIAILLLVGLVVKVFMAGKFKGFEVDMNCFKYWGNQMLEQGPASMYDPDTFTDYPPGYLYVLGFVSFLCKLFHVDTASAMGDVFFKLPACLCDLAAGFFIYKIAGRKLNQTASLICAALYIFNPAVLINSSVWGQVDAVYVLFVIMMMYFILERKLPIAYVIFGVGILAKPQMTFFTPVLIWAIVEQVFLDGFDKKNFFINLFTGLGAILLMVILAIPFGVGRVISQFTDTLGSYEYASVNAYNFWAMIGKNWTSQTEKLFFLTYNQWGTIFLILVLSSAVYLLYKARKDESKYWFASAYMMAGIFMFSVRMHERYMFPVLILLLLTFVVKPVKQIFYAYIGFSAVQLLNVGHVLYYYDAHNFSRKAMVPIMVAAATLIMIVYLLCIALKWYFGGIEKSARLYEQEMAQIKAEDNNTVKTFLFPKTVTPSSEPLKMLKWDWIVLGAIVLIYGAIALYDLGVMNAPETEFMDEQYNSTITIDLGKTTDVAQVAYYLGNYESRNITVEYSNTADEESFNQLSTFEMTSVMRWGTTDVNVNARYLRLICTNNALSLFELAILDADGAVIEPQAVLDNGAFVAPEQSEKYRTLFDEQDTYAEYTYRNGSYFDEVYHARTAFEYINGRYSYENTHPPLGKGFIALGMLIFGINPFGWRIMGTLFGIAMLPFIYLFAKKLFKETWISGVITTLFAFDFMHFTQTRIATIDVYVTFFIILMYFFMYCYTKRSFYDRPIIKTWGILALSGVSMGLGIASKWTGVYAGAGLGVIFFVDLYRRFNEYRYAKEHISGSTKGISHSVIAERFKKDSLKTILVCVIFFVIAPILIYTLSYLPFSDGTNSGLIKEMLKNQETMFSYHSKLESTHPYSSTWYQWPFMWRPMYYYVGTVSETVREGISAFGNPLVWYAGIPALIYMFYLLFNKKDRKALFLLIGYFAQYLPWMLVTRTTYIYHYFTCIPFVALMLGYSIYNIVGNNKKRRKWAYLYVAGALVLFAMFYPVISGHAASMDYVENWLRWFDKWVLVS